MKKLLQIFTNKPDSPPKDKKNPSSSEGNGATSSNSGNSGSSAINNDARVPLEVSLNNKLVK